LASLDAHSLAASMRANRVYWTDASTPVNFTIQAPVSGTTPTITPSMDWANCAAQPCTPEQLAGYDLRTWGAELAGMQHNSTATITRIANTGTSASAYSVRVVWTEQQMKRQVAPGSAPAPSAATHHTVVVVQP